MAAPLLHAWHRRNRHSLGIHFSRGSQKHRRLVQGLALAENQLRFDIALHTSGYRNPVDRSVLDRLNIGKAVLIENCGNRDRQRVLGTFRSFADGLDS